MEILVAPIVVLKWKTTQISACYHALDLGDTKAKGSLSSLIYILYCVGIVIVLNTNA